MSRIVAVENVTLDGVMQAPGRADEDTRGGFAHGGWAAPYEVMGSLMGERRGATGAMLFGRRTYEDFAGFWPHQTDNPFTEVLNATLKYVVVDDAARAAARGATPRCSPATRRGGRRAARAAGRRPRGPRQRRARAVADGAQDLDRRVLCC